jgi:hypothetical protein
MEALRNRRDSTGAIESQSGAPILAAYSRALVVFTRSRWGPEMITVLAMVFASLACASPTQEAPKKEAAATSVLDELIEKSKKISAFSATFTMLHGDDPSPTTIRCEYRAPATIRLTIAAEDGTLTTWCIDGVTVMRSSGKDAPVHARVDSRAFTTNCDSINGALKREFGKPAWDSGPAQASLSMSWSFDTAAQEGNFSLSGGAFFGPSSPFGWLETLRRKNVESTVAGDLIRFTTDEGHDDIAIGRADGFLHEFIGRSPDSQLKLRLESVVVDPAEPLGKVDFPSDQPEGDDLSAKFRSALERIQIQSMREGVYGVIVAATDEEPWDADARARIERSLQPLSDWMVHFQGNAWMAQMHRWIEVVAGPIHESERDGDAFEVERLRSRAKKDLEDKVAEVRQKTAFMLGMPLTSPVPGRGHRILEIERDVMGKEFDAIAREPLLAALAKATGASGK